ncbi:MAG TPA: D-2-hydroxyacid dehydrogenase [Roseiflexaceae bacterium]|jgi:phosphoglycerate dehydrogenase-like enzyme|nr:D-2-hydroxyacid dehydrogenase [Roseiflexaceae bacterium]
MKLVLPQVLADELAPRVSAAAPQAAIVWFDEHGHASGDIGDATVLLRWFTPPEVLNSMVERMPALRWLHIPRVGIDSSLVPAVMERDILITNSAGINAEPIAEFVMLFMLCHAKQARELLQFQAAREWGWRSVQPVELTRKTVLIIGMGKIGQAIARRAKAFDMRVIGSRRRPQPVANVDYVMGDGEWRAHLGEADFVVVAAPLTPATRGMFGAAELAAMRPDAYLINVARGEIVDEAALVDALRGERIAGAGLDVFTEEPLPPDHPFWGLPNVFLTPHVSWYSPEVRPRTLSLFAENLQRFASGQPLLNIVDKQAGY